MLEVWKIKQMCGVKEKKMAYTAKDPCPPLRRFLFQ